MGYLWGIYSGYFMGIVPYQGLFIRAPAHYMYMIGRNFDICLIGFPPSCISGGSNPVFTFRSFDLLFWSPSHSMPQSHHVVIDPKYPKISKNHPPDSSSNSSNQPWLAGQFPIQTQFEKQTPSQKAPLSSGISTWRFNRDHCPIQKLYAI